MWEGKEHDTMFILWRHKNQKWMKILLLEIVVFKGFQAVDSKTGNIQGLLGMLDRNFEIQGFFKVF